MSSLKLQGATSGEITVTVPNVAGTNTLTLPATTGTVLDTNSSLSAPNLSGDIPIASFPTGTILQVVSNTPDTGIVNKMI